MTIIFLTKYKHVWKSTSGISVLNQLFISFVCVHLYGYERNIKFALVFALVCECSYKGPKAGPRPHPQSLALTRSQYIRTHMTPPPPPLPLKILDPPLIKYSSVEVWGTGEKMAMKMTILVPTKKCGENFSIILETFSKCSFLFLYELQET